MSYSKIPASGLQTARIRFYYTITELFDLLKLYTGNRAANIKDGNGRQMLDEVGLSNDESQMVKQMIRTAIYNLGSEVYKIANGVKNSIFHDSKITLTNSISTITLGTGGTGYAAGDILEVVQSGGENGCVRVATVSNGAVATFDAIVGSSEMGGNGYTVANGIPTTAFTGSGSGCTVNITAVATVNLLSVNSSGFSIVDQAAYNEDLLPVIDDEIRNCILESCMSKWYGATLGLVDDYNYHSREFEKYLGLMRKHTQQFRAPSIS